MAKLLRKLTHEELLKRQEALQLKARLPLTVVLNDIRSLYNVGSIFRTADGAGIEKLYLCGITGFPPDNQISKTALGAEERVPWEYCRDLRKCLLGLKEHGYQIVLLEQAVQSVPYEEFMPQGPVCLVLGNEISGVSEEILDLCDAAVEIEMTGLKNSLNVSVAFGVVAFHLRTRMNRVSNSYHG